MDESANKVGNKLKVIKKKKRGMKLERRGVAAAIPEPKPRNPSDIGRISVDEGYRVHDEEARAKKGKKLKVIKKRMKKKRGMKLEFRSAAAAIPESKPRNPSDNGTTYLDKWKYLQLQKLIKSRAAEEAIPEPNPSDNGTTYLDEFDVDEWKYHQLQKLIKSRAAEAAIPEPNPSLIGRISVTGFDGHDHEDVKSALREHFASCGKITDVFITDVYNHLGGTYAYIYFVGEGAVEKALKLNGSEVAAGGWKVCAKPCPFDDDTPILAKIKGYIDISLSDSEMEAAVREFFSSCGEVTEVIFPKDYGYYGARIRGIDAALKALELNGSYIGRHKVGVRILSKSPRHSTHRVYGYGRTLPPALVDAYKKAGKNI